VTIIKKAAPEDLDGIVKIENETSAAPWSREALSRDIAREDALVLAARDDDVTGYADAWIVAGEMQLNNIGVTADSRRRGIASHLMTELIAEAGKAGCTLITLEVRAGNEAALALYGKYGFKKTGLRPGYYEDNGEDAILMDLEIN